MKNSICFILLLILSFGVNAQNSSELKEKIETNSAKMQEAMAAGDMEKFGNFFAEDVMFKMSGQQPLSGRAAVASAHKPMAAGGLKLMVNTEEVMDFGDYAHEIGNYEIHTPDGKKVDHGHYSTLWKKIDGEWKIYRDVISSSVAVK